MRKSILVAVLILAIGAIPRLLEQRRLTTLRAEHRGLTAAAAGLGLSGDPAEPPLTKRQREERDGEALAVAAEWISLTKEREALDRSGLKPDETFDKRHSELTRRVEKLDAYQLTRVIAEVRGNREISVDSRRTMIGTSIVRIARDRPHMALELYLESVDLLGGREEGGDAMSTALSRLAELNPQAASEWVRRNATTFSENSDDDVNRELIGSMAASDPQLAFKLLGTLRFEDPADALQSIMEAAGESPEKRTGILTALRGHMDSLSEDDDRDRTRSEAFEALARNLGEEDIDSVTRWISQSRFTPEETARFAGGLTFLTTKGDTGRWIEWLSENLPADSLAEPVASLVGEWTQQDYQAAGHWLAATPESAGKHAAVLAYAEAVAEYEPRIAGQWAATLPPGPEREEALRVIYQNWPGGDPEGAAAFAREHGMD